MENTFYWGGRGYRNTSNRKVENEPVGGKSGPFGGGRKVGEASGRIGLTRTKYSVENALMKLSTLQANFKN